MRYPVAFMEKAELDLEDIEEYLSKFYSGTAANFFSKLKKKLTALETMPYICPEYEADPFFRRMVIDDYLLFYEVNTERKLVIVHRVFHSARDVSQQIMS